MRRVLAIALLASWLPGADTPPAPPAQTPPAGAVAPPLPPRDDGLAKLREALPATAWVVERDGRLWWQFDGGEALAIVGVDDERQPLVEAAGLRVAVTRRLLESARPDAHAALRALAPAGKAAAVEGLALAEGPLTGLHLRTPEVVVLPEGTLRKTTVEAGDRTGEVARIKTANEGLVTALPQLSIDETTRRTLANVLGKLTEPDGKGELDDLDPAFARRVVRSGWLRQVFTTITADEAVEQAVREAERLRPTLRFAAEGCELAEVRDAFGHGGWMIRTPRRSALLVDHLLPIYYQPYPGLKLVAELPPGSDPLAATAPTGLRLWRLADGAWEAVAAAEAGKPLCESANGAWRRAVPQRTRGNLVGGWMPLHAVVSDLHGDVLALATAQGWLAPPRSAERTEGERFLAEAARQLPDAAHLDLLGQYLMQYVYDSPDPRRPTLIGDKQNKGDIHQTTYETLASVAGGMLRGDCDDAAELYQTIAERQGRTAHVVSLPSHAACAWAEKQGETWKVILLQTGPAYEFADGDLKQALAKTYKHFDESDTFDPNGIGLLLRFDNENQRGPWRLSYRIFEDPEYARIMIDVQKDWHYQTYARGIDKMRKLIASGEREAKETANFRELSGLFSFTGQYQEAAEYHQKAIELTPASDPLSGLYMRVELIGHLFDAGKERVARDEALDLLEHGIPDQRKRLGPSLMQLGAQLAGTLAEHRQRDLAVRALRPALDMLDERMGEALGRKNGKKPGKPDGAGSLAGMHALGDWLEGPDFDPKLWEGHPALEQFRRLSQMLVGAAIRTLEGASQADIAADPGLQHLARTVQVWLDRISFRDVDDAGEALFRFASAGRAYEILLGTDRFAALIEAAPRPAPARVDPARRVGGIAQVALDAGWLKLSVPFWFAKMADHFDRQNAAIDAAAARAAARKTIEAGDALAGSDLEMPHLAHQVHIARVVLALLDQDEKALRERLRLVQERNDKSWRDDTAQWLGDAARAVPPAWYPKVLQAWTDEVGYKPKYFWIAWRAALGKAPQHALLAAEAACRRFPDDAGFAEELAFMRQLLQPKPDKAAPGR